MIDSNPTIQYPLYNKIIAIIVAIITPIPKAILFTKKENTELWFVILVNQKLTSK